jgi:hypothetical protein
MTDESETTALLREIRDNQRTQLEQQAEALDMQRKLHAMAQGQMERAERLQGRAEAIQGRAGRAIKAIAWIAVPLLLLLIVLLLWPQLVRGGY